jgi:hypothetical protein
MTDILSFDVPRTIGDLGDLLPKIDALKKISHLYQYECELRYKSSRPLDDNNLDMIKPKHLKSNIHSFSLI